MQSQYHQMAHMGTKGANDLLACPPPKWRKGNSSLEPKKGHLHLKSQLQIQSQYLLHRPKLTSTLDTLNGELWNFRTKGTQLLSLYVSFIHSFIHQILIQYLCNRDSISTPCKSCCFMQLINAILSSISKAKSLKSMIS